MVTTPFLEPSRIWPVHTRIPDEHEGDILSTTDDHFAIVAAIRGDLERYARRAGFAWLLRADAPIRYPRADGSTGSLYLDILVAHGVTVPGYGPYNNVEVGKAPELLIEILSKETARKDEDDVKGKRRVYAEMGVFEYLTFDPRPRKKLALHGYRLARIGQYAEVPPTLEVVYGWRASGCASWRRRPIAPAITGHCSASTVPMAARFLTSGKTLTRETKLSRNGCRLSRHGRLSAGRVYGLSGRRSDLSENVTRRWPRWGGCGRNCRARPSNGEGM